MRTFRTLGLLALSALVVALATVNSNSYAQEKKKEAVALPAAPMPTAVAAIDLTAELNDSALKIFAALQPQIGEGNSVWFPTVTGQSTNVVRLASSGTARTEIDTTFPYLTKGKEKEVGSMLSGVGNDKLSFKMETLLLLGKGVGTRPTFTKNAKAFYGVHTFGIPTDRPADAVNAWFGAQSGGKLKDVVSPSLFSGSLRLMLTTAATIKGDWVDGFDKTDSKEAEFTLSDEKTKVKTKFMKKDSSYFVGEVTDGQVLVIPVKGNASALFIVSKAGKKVEDVIKSLTAADIKGIVEKAGKPDATKKAEVSIPVIKTSGSSDLKKAFTALGIKKAFDPKPSPSDLSFDEMTSEDVAIGEFFQKATISIDETGFEGAAAEVVTFRARGIDLTPKVQFNVDRPYLFLVINEKGLIATMVRVNNPTK